MLAVPSGAAQGSPTTSPVAVTHQAPIAFSRGLLRQYFESNTKTRYLEPPEPMPPLDDASTPSLEALIDMMLVLHEECSHSKFTDTGMRDFLAHFQPCVEAVQQRRVSAADFDLKKLLATTPISEIWLGVSRWRPHTPLAVKVMPKSTANTNAQSLCFRDELQLLTAAATLRWGGEVPTVAPLPPGGLENILGLRFAFQDAEKLYLATDFCAGADLLALLEKFDAFTEDMARYYIAQVVVAVEAAHALGYAHRGISAENVLISARGHVVLADFGSCCRLDKDGLVPVPRMAVPGGTPDYICPELLGAIQGDSQVRYGGACDWWSIGVLLCELLCGDTPFQDESLLKVYRNIRQHDPANFKKDERMSPEAQDLVSRLCCPQAQRLGKGGAAEIKRHPFFKGVDWLHVRDMKPPFIPELASAMDTSLFETKEMEDASAKARGSVCFSRVPSKLDTLDTQLPFVGYYYMAPLLDVEHTSGPLRHRRRPSDSKFHLAKRASAPLSPSTSAGPVPLPYAQPNAASASLPPPSQPGPHPPQQPTAAPSAAQAPNAAAASSLAWPAPSQTASSIANSTPRLLPATPVRSAGTILIGSLPSTPAPAAVAPAGPRANFSTSAAVQAQTGVGSTQSALSAQGSAGISAASASVSAAAPADRRNPSPSSVGLTSPTSPRSGSSARFALVPAAATLQPAPARTPVSPLGSPQPTRAPTAASLFDSAAAPAQTQGTPATPPRTVTQEKTASAAARTPKSCLRSAAAPANRSRRVVFEKEAVFLEYAREGDLAVIRELIEGGAVVDIDLRGVLGQTALILACENGHLPLVAYLCERGANVNLPSDSGCTPLHFAIDHSYEDIAIFLLEHGADGSLPNADDETALDWAVESSMTRLVGMMLARK